MERVGKLINRLSTINHNDSNNRLKEYGLTENEGTILMILKHHQSIYQENIIKELQVDKSAVTRLLKNMESKGLIERVQSDKDKRYYLIKITKLGIEKQILVDEVFKQKDIVIVKGLTLEEQVELKRMLKIIKGNLMGGKRDE